MPLPEPHKDESEDEFMERCMGDPAIKEFDDHKQRIAVCMSQWKQKEREAVAIEVQYRLFPVEFRLENGERPRIRGYAAVFNETSEPLGGFRERIAPGAFKKTLKEQDIRALFNHDPSRLLGRTKNGTLVLREDDKGLWMEIDPPDTAEARDLLALIARGDVDQASFAFRVVKDNWDYGEKPPTRTLEEVTLYDASVVTYPAYPQTHVDVRSLVAYTTDSEQIRTAIDVLQTRSGPGDHPDGAEPDESTPQPEPQEHSESVRVRKLSILVKEWRREVELGV